MNRNERIIRLDRLIRDARYPVSIGKIKEELECSISTSRRTIRHLRDLIGAPLEYDQKYNGYYYDSSEKFELPGFWLTPEEIYALFICHEVVEKNREVGLSSLIKPLNKRIESILKSLGHSVETLRSRIKVIPLFSRSIKKNEFSKICSAVLENRIIEVKYFKRSCGKTDERIIHPQRIINYKTNWYLIAFCQKRKKLRTFSLENIEVLKSKKESIKLSEEEIDKFIEDSFGVFSGESTHIAKLRFFNSSANWVKDEFWHKNENKYFDGKDLILEIPYGNPTELIMEILRYGDSVIVESPNELKQAVMEKLSNSIKNYEG